MAPRTSLFPQTYTSPSRIWATRDRPASIVGRVLGADHQGAGRRGGVEPGTDRVAKDRRDDAEQAAERRAEDAGKLGGQRVGRDRPREQSERHQHRAEGAGRRLEERPGAAEQRGQGEDRPESAPERRSGRQPDRGHELRQVAEGQDRRRSCRSAASPATRVSANSGRNCARPIIPTTNEASRMDIVRRATS